MHKVSIFDVNAVLGCQAWLALRHEYLTATDWPKITGASRWGDASTVIADKASLPDDEERVLPLPMRVGKELEPLIIESIKKEWGEGDYLSQVFIARKYMGFTPDLLLWEGDQWKLAEVKVSIRDWNGWVPEDYLDQVRFQATVLGVREVHVVHLKLSSWAEGSWMIGEQSVPTDRLTVYVVPVSASEREQITRRSERWWNANIGS